MNTIRIKLNGRDRTLEGKSTIGDLIVELDLAQERVAIEHNGVLVEAEKAAELTLTDGDRLELVRFVGGG
jgi:thiamine biosynthesis protein ThiS